MRPATAETNPVVTIVVVAHSVRDELERCFASIGRHAGVPVETILVDNASDDDTRRMGRRGTPRGRRRRARRERRRRRTRPRTAARARPVHDVPGLRRRADRRGAPGDGRGDGRPPGLGARRTAPGRGRGRAPVLRAALPAAAPPHPAPPAARSVLRAPAHRPPPPDGGDRPGATREVLYVLGACQLFRTSLAATAGPFDDRVFLGWDDADWCIRIRDAGGDVVYFPAATVVHSYRRLTKQQPVSRAALRQLRAHAALPAHATCCDAPSSWPCSGGSTARWAREGPHRGLGGDRRVEGARRRPALPRLAAASTPASPTRRSSSTTARRTARPRRCAPRSPSATVLAKPAERGARRRPQRTRCPRPRAPTC